MLVESTDTNEVANQPFFEKFPEVRLYRGIRKPFEEITKLSFKFRTKPLDSVIEAHDAINKESEEVFGIPVRNLMFSYTEEESAESYGEVCIIVPIGESFKLFYNPDVEDLTAYEGLSRDSYHERMLETVMDQFFTLDIANEVVDDSYWEMIDVVNGLIDKVTFHSDDMLSELKQFMQNNIHAGIQLVAKKHNTNEERLDELHDYADQSGIVDDVTEKFKVLMDDYLERMASQYVEGIEEVDEEDDLDLSNNPEIMIYAPDGFYVIPKEYMDEFESI